MEMMYSKHYVRLDSNNRIIKGFSDAFEEPLETDICINECGGRHFELDHEINPSLIDLNSCHLYKYENGEIKETTEEEKNVELEARPIPPYVPTSEDYIMLAIAELDKQREIDKVANQLAIAELAETVLAKGGTV